MSIAGSRPFGIPFSEPSQLLRKARPRWPHWAVGAFFLAFTVFIVALACKSSWLGDFSVNREFGRRFLARETLYAGGCSFNYMPVSAMFMAPLALVPPGVGLLLRYTVALACLYYVFFALGRMLGRFSAQRAGDHATCAALTLGLGLHYLQRDLCDGGLHLIYLAIIVAGIDLVWQGRERLSAFWFGLAIVLKMSPGLFLPFFLWKRKWRLAAYTCLWSALLVVLPAAWLGWSDWWSQQCQWNDVGLAFFSQKWDNPWRTDNEVVVQNQALKPALVRLMVAYPEGHRLRVPHPADVPLLNIPEQTAHRLATFVMLALVAGFAWWSRKPYARFDDPAWLVESSAVLLLVLLLAPLVWVQHMVFIMPALYLIVVHDRGSDRLPRIARAAVWLYLLLSLGLNREILGSLLYRVVLSYHVHTLCMLIVLALVMCLRPSERTQLAGAAR